MTLTPTIWLVTGLFLMFLELLTPGFVVFFFGLSAMTVALLARLFPGMGAGWELGLFSAFSVFYIVALRKWVKGVFEARRARGRSPEDGEVGRAVRVVRAIRPPEAGRVELFGAEWDAVSVRELPEGAAARVVARDNLTLTVEPLDGPPPLPQQQQQPRP